jgi:hypothetical protein
MARAGSSVRRLVLSTGVVLFAAVASVLLIGLWLELIGLGINEGLGQGGWFPYGIVLGELLLVGVITGLVPGSPGKIRRLFVYAVIACLMVGANVLLVIFAIHIY